MSEIMTIEEKQKILKESAERFAERTMREAGDELFRKKMGRPPLPENKKRENNRITVYLNDAELETIRRRAEQAGGSLSDYARKKILQ